MLAEILPAEKKRPTKSLYNPANNGLRERTTTYSVLDYYVNVSHVVVCNLYYLSDILYGVEPKRLAGTQFNSAPYIRTLWLHH